MAVTVTSDAALGWRGRNVGIGQVLRALDELRRREQRLATRTSVVTLIVVAANSGEMERAAAAAGPLCGRHPGRTVTLTFTDRPGLDAEVALYQSGADDATVWSEEVRLSVGGPVVEHLDSLVEPLTLPDLPVAVWWVGRLPAPSNPLVGAADAVLVDTKEAGGPPLDQVLQIARRRPVTDLSWTRLQPWRRLLGGLFEGAAYRPFVAGVRSAEVLGKEGPRRLLAGWLASRLALPDTALHLAGARHVTMRLHAEHQGRRAVFTVARADGERLVRASAQVDGGPRHDDVLPLPDDSLPWSLAEALTHLGRDRRYEDAVRATALH